MTVAGDVGPAGGTGHIGQVRNVGHVMQLRHTGNIKDIVIVGGQDQNGRGGRRVGDDHAFGYL